MKKSLIFILTLLVLTFSLSFISFANELIDDSYVVRIEDFYTNGSVYTNPGKVYYYHAQFGSAFIHPNFSTMVLTGFVYENGYFIGSDGTKYLVLQTSDGSYMAQIYEPEYNITHVYQNPVFYIVIAFSILIFVIICFIVYRKIYKKRLVDKEGSTTEEDESSNKW